MVPIGSAHVFTYIECHGVEVREDFMQEHLGAAELARVMSNKPIVCLCFRPNQNKIGVRMFFGTQTPRFSLALE